MSGEDIRRPIGVSGVEVDDRAPKPLSRSRGDHGEKSVRFSNRGLTGQEKRERVRDIDEQVAGGSTLRSAVENVGISDQTYYLWKKALAAAPRLATLQGDEYGEFIQLDEENRRLRKLLAEKLRAENADLRRRLGLK